MRKYNKKYQIFLLLNLLVFSSFIHTIYDSNNLAQAIIVEKRDSPQGFSSLQSHLLVQIEPFVINGNEELEDQSILRGWDGNGSLLNPYIIKDYNITNEDGYLLQIKNTNLFITIENCFLSRGEKNIFFQNVSNVLVRNNLVIGSPGRGVEILNGNNINLSNNCIKNNIIGLRIYNSTNCRVIDNNIIENNIGLYIYHNPNEIRIEKNNMSNNTYEGLKLELDTKLSLKENIIKSNVQGILIKNNSMEFIIYDNIISLNNGGGIVMKNSMNGQITSNLFLSNQLQGVVLEECNTNNISLNDFIDNRIAEASQAIDTDGSGNVFMDNYWDNIEVIDQDNNGYIDFPHKIDGNTNNFDYSPKTTSYKFITSPVINLPLTSTILEGNIQIEWEQSFDYWNEPIHYTIFYTNQSDDSWILEKSQLNETNYIFNTSKVMDTAFFKLKILAHSISGMTNEFITNNYQIINEPLNLPIFKSQELLDNITGKFWVEWEKVHDHWNRSLFYYIYYKYNESSNWILCGSTSDTYWRWDTYNLLNGTDYRLKVRAKCVSGIETDYILNESITIINPSHQLTTPEIIFPIENVEINRTVKVDWTEVVDTWENPVLYSLFYSNDSQLINWIELVSDTPYTHFYWNTTLLVDGDDYIVKIVATNSKGNTTEVVSNGSFCISNHKPTIPLIISHCNYSVVCEYIDIIWKESVVPYGYNTNYTLFYSLDGIHWTLLNSLDTTTYNLRTYNYGNGLLHIKVKSTSEENISSENVIILQIANMNRMIFNLAFQENINTNQNEKILTLSWIEAIETWGNNISYSLFFTNDGGKTWELINDLIINESYSIPKTQLNEGRYCQFKLITQSIELYSHEILTEEIVTNLFELWFHEHKISEPTIISLTKNCIINGTFTFEWFESIDSYRYQITYEIYHSTIPAALHPSNDHLWTLITDTKNTSFTWDTTKIPSYYQNYLKIVAVSENGDKNYSITEPFVIQNIAHTLTDPEILEPINLSECLQWIELQWNESIDSLGYPVFYSVHISYDNGSKWFTIIDEREEPRVGINMTWFMENNQEFNSSLYEEQENKVYLLKVIAKSEGGLQKEYILDITSYVTEKRVSEFNENANGWILPLSLISLFLIVRFRKHKK